MAFQGEVVLRQRVCHGNRCHAVFWVCEHCDRGQRYCSPACRAAARVQQRRRANGRHQRSPKAGKIIATGSESTGAASASCA